MRNLVAAIHLILTLKCEQSTRLVSESLDRDLSLLERSAVRLHYIGCWSCRRFGKQVKLLRKATRLGRSASDADRLSPKTIARIREAIRAAGTDNAGS